MFAPESFDFVPVLDGPIGNPKGFSVVVHYRFVTMTALGYGDIIPLTHLARSIAIALTVLGQLYLVILIARLVALHIARTENANR